MREKLRVAIVFGGSTYEHTISLLSARYVLSVIDQEKFTVIPIAIDLQGNWFQVNRLQEFLSWNGEAICSDLTFLEPIDPTLSYLRNTLDVIFPLIHGSPGEDGGIQGFCSLLSIPCVGADVLSSAICMDKIIMKKLFQHAGVPIAKYLSCRSDHIFSFEDARGALGLPLVVKPSNRGSSLGVNKVDSAEEWDAAIDSASALSDYLIFEEYIQGRELECSILGNRNPIASKSGEIDCVQNFYSYNAKYVHADLANLRVPATVSFDIERQLQKLALQVFDIMRCRGMARIDFFLLKTGELLVNEVNTIPGFTAISLYPKLLEITGYPAKELINALIDFALDASNRKFAFINE
ncbi:MAG: D-alanine--D-alanine ligase family protein [Chlamydiales bacterium]